MTKYDDDDTVNSFNRLYAAAVWNDGHEDKIIMIFNEKTGFLTLLVLDSYLCFEGFCQNSHVNNKKKPCCCLCTAVL